MREVWGAANPSRQGSLPGVLRGSPAAASARSTMHSGVMSDTAIFAVFIPVSRVILRRSISRTRALIMWPPATRRLELCRRNSSSMVWKRREMREKGEAGQWKEDGRAKA